MKRVLSGLDNIHLADDKLKNRRIGLMTNPTGINHAFQSNIDILREKYALTALFACEHGIRGNIQAGEDVDTYADTETGITVFSTYGKNKEFTKEKLDAFDVLVFDMQDVGARFYTYLYSLSNAMIACAAAGKPLIVLDRLNPLGGERIEGTMLNECFHSFVGEFALPTRYALTIGEYARFVKKHLNLSLDLMVVPLSGWTRDLYLDDTDTPWVAPSPNCATMQAALVYTGTCIFEGTNLSEGRGTTQPFELVGAPWVNDAELAHRMNEKNLSGVHFRRTSFTPQFSKHAGALCHGVQLHITDRHTANVFYASLLLSDEIRAMHGDCFAWDTPRDVLHIDHLLGTTDYSSGRLDARGLYEAHLPALREFEKEKKEYELY